MRAQGLSGRIRVLAERYAVTHDAVVVGRNGRFSTHDAGIVGKE